MSKFFKSKIFLSLILIILIALVGTLGFALGAKQLGPLQVVSHYDLNVLISDANNMVECVECHEAENFHSCETCHDDHGAIELAGVPFYAMIEFTGDVPAPGYILLDDILPYRDQPHTHIPLLEMLQEQGVEDFESVTLASPDGGFITIAKDQLTSRALLLPYEDGVRFASEDLHVSTWLKGIRRIIVVGKDTPLQINGEATSFGRLLLGPTKAVTVEQAAVMFQSEEDGEIRKAFTASRLEGIPLNEIFQADSFKQLSILDQSGKVHTFTPDEIEGAILAPIHANLTLVFPERGRSQWIEGVRSLEIEG